MENDDDLLERALVTAGRAQRLAIAAMAFLLIGMSLGAMATPTDPQLVWRLPLPPRAPAFCGIAAAIVCGVGAILLTATEIAITRQVQTLDRARGMADRLRRRKEA